MNKSADCKHCRWAFELNGDLFCKRFPPTVQQVVRPTALANRPEFGMASVWPMVREGEWCGEYEVEINETH